ncbi:MAG: ADP-ribosylation/crystallin J1 [Paracoccaceae bacterium]
MQLFRPTGLRELELVRDSGWRRWPLRLPDQPIFYPVTTFEYAEKIARDWNSPGPGNLGFVTRFVIGEALVARYPVQLAGGRDHAELWVPAEELDAFNAGLDGRIELIAGYRDRLRLTEEELAVYRG